MHGRRYVGLRIARRILGRRLRRISRRRRRYLRRLDRLANGLGRWGHLSLNHVGSTRSRLIGAIHPFRPPARESVLKFWSAELGDVSNYEQSKSRYFRQLRRVMRRQGRRSWAEGPRGKVKNCFRLSINFYRLGSSAVEWWVDPLNQRSGRGQHSSTDLVEIQQSARPARV
jgi:hypothetical protein